MRATLLISAVVGLLSLACGVVSSPESTPTITPTATATATPEPTATPAPTPTPTPIPEVNPGQAIVVGGVVRTRTQPSSQADQAGVRGDLQPLEIAATVQGEDWVVGSQTWLSSAPPDWATQWYQLTDGSYVYGAFVFILPEGETSPLAPSPNGEEKWIDVNLTTQTARAMEGDQAVFTAPISSGAPPFETPQGSFAVEPDGRIAVERMTASQAGYDPNQAQYDVERVLFTQYFDQKGDALHVNYWRPSSVFGHQATSHGCVGMELHAAQYFWLFAEPGTRVEVHP